MDVDATMSHIQIGLFVTIDPIPTGPIPIINACHGTTGQRRIRTRERVPLDIDAGLRLSRDKRGVPPLKGEVASEASRVGSTAAIARVERGPHPTTGRFAPGDRPPTKRGRY
jgi:hypothetical protein